MAFSRRSLLGLLFLLLQASTFAFADKKSYIVYMGAHSHGRNPTEEDFERATHSHHNFLASFLGSHEEAKSAIFYSYKRYINGFSAILEEHQAAEIAKHPSVVSVFLNKGRKLHTTHSWDFMLLAKNGTAMPHSLWTKARLGEDTIIANIDSGVWPESSSFDDAGYGPLPKRWKGACNGGPGFKCNRKLIGSRFYNKGYLACGGEIPSSMNTSRDFEGHGSHTLSTIGGNLVSNVSLLGLNVGTAKGGSPRARVAAYKVCWKPYKGAECFDSDILEAIDQAIHDGVDVLSLSLGASAALNYFEDGNAIGAFHAVSKGVVVVCSAGNDGPSPETVANVAPWIFTVGASTIDREFQTYVMLGNGRRLKGTSLSKALEEYKFFPLISGAQAKLANASVTDAMLCKAGSLDPSKVKGKILACLRGDNLRMDKGMQAYLAGAKAMILCNDQANGNDVNADLHILPASHLSYSDGLQVFSYINTTGKPWAYLTPPAVALNTKPAPFMASFSSRGPNPITPEIIKPDVTAPGVNIIASYSEATSPTEEDTDPRRVSFTSMSGTSMSCPHVAGVVGLLKTLYPHWSPAAIRSAIMTTARTRDNTMRPILDSNSVEATPLSYGSGHIRPNRAMDPGLVYDMSTNDYLHFLCSLGYNETLIQPFLGHGRYKCHPKASLRHFNYPSISVPHLGSGSSVTLRRKVTNVGPPGTYTVAVKQPSGASIRVHPRSLSFSRVGERKSFKVTVKGKFPSNGYVFGRMSWSDGKRYVQSPIAVNVHN